MRARRTTVAVAVILSVTVLAACLAGCDPRREARQEQAGRSRETSSGALSADRPGQPTPPPPPMLRDPESAVYSYLLWANYAYRTMESEVATALTPTEWNRVDALIELNRQQGRAIDQRLTGFDVLSAQTRGETATLVAEESWEYRYIGLESRRYEGPVQKVSYDTTYTVVRAPEGWRVERVEASARPAD